MRDSQWLTGRDQTIGGLERTTNRFIYNNGTAARLHPDFGSTTSSVADNTTPRSPARLEQIVGSDSGTAGGLTSIKNLTSPQRNSCNIPELRSTASTITVNNGTLVLPGSNTYAGATTDYSGGTLKVGYASALGRRLGLPTSTAAARWI